LKHGQIKLGVVSSLGKGIAAASIVAKVHRDRLMQSYHRDYPAYHFDANKGYASRDHITAIEKMGLCPIHRRSFCRKILERAGQLTISLPPEVR